MTMETATMVRRETKEIASVYLGRIVKFDCFLPTSVREPEDLTLLLINDGQDLGPLGLHAMLESLYASGEIRPLLCVGVHAGEERKLEYGTANFTDYKGRGAKASLYTRFVFEELIPTIQTSYLIPSFKQKAFAGFSLGALSALDIVWNHPDQFARAGVFSGALWWRSKAIEDGYAEDTDRIMHKAVRDGDYHPSLKFFFQTGTEDETADRNNNGIIDSIDDTVALMGELQKKGYIIGKDIIYMEVDGGRHDIPTWAVAMPYFLRWGFAPEK